MNRFFKIIICALLCVLLFGCTQDNTKSTTSFDVSTATTSAENDVSIITANEIEEVTSQASTKKEKQETEKNNTEKQSTAKTAPAKGKKKSKTQSTTNKKATTAQHTVTAFASTSENNAFDSTTAQTITQETSITESTVITTSSELICTVEIECTKILENLDSLKSGHEAYVPSNGILLSEYTVTLPSASSAYDALSKACEENNITLSSKKTMYGTYVSGINNLDEKDCTKGGGWIYKVNGTSPPKSSNKYILSNGDKVVFSYTCS
ncbi:MAG: DUF4430 domain-containing protein [Eubacterium sp.]